jgi:hypothetical protein
MKPRTGFFIVSFMAAISVRPAFTQAPPQAEIDELKVQIQLLKEQQATSQRMIDAIEQRVDALQKALISPIRVARGESSPVLLARAVLAAPIVATVPLAEVAPVQIPVRAEQQPPPISGPVSGRAPGMQPRDVFSENRNAAPRIDNVPLDPEMVGFFRLGDSPTVMRLGGYAKLDVIHDFKLPGDPDAFVTSTLPLEPVPPANSTNLHIRQSRFNVELRRPTPIGGLRIFYENDFFGTSPTTFRLRHLYGQLENVLVGWTFSTFMDIDAFPDTLDFEGPGGLVFMSQPQFRYTWPVTKANSLAFGIEKPTTDANITNPTRPNVEATPTTPIPDFVIRYRFETERGHLQVATVLRSVGGSAASTETQGVYATKHVFGWGQNLAGSVKTYKRDGVQFQAAYGNGIGRYLEDLTGLGADVAVNNNKLVATPAFGTFGAYQHYWTDKWRSSAVYGFLNLQREPSQAPTFFHQSRYSAGNLIWNPAGKLDIGLEYLYGRLISNGDDHGYGSRLQMSLKYDFYKWSAERK